MYPINFEESNTLLTGPHDMEASQYLDIRGYVGDVRGGSLDGMKVIVTAWKLTEAELEKLNQGGLVYASFVGGLPPHFLTTEFNEAIRPA